MDSNPQATPSQAPKLHPLSTSSSTGYFLPIRAPPTLDSDFQYSKKRQNSTSTSSSFTSDSDDNSVFEESEGFVSGEDAFETASETLGGTENVVSRPFVKNVDEKEIQISDEEEEEYTSPRVQIEPVIDIGVPLLPKFGMPIAQLSADSDDDSVSSVFYEEDGFLGSIRVPNVGFNSVPKVNETELEHEDEDESYFEAVETDVVEDSISLDCHEEEDIYVNDSVKDSVSVEDVKNNGIVLTREGEAESSEDVKYTVEEVEINIIRCANNEDKEVVVEDTETSNDVISALFKADDNRADFASESNETNPNVMAVEVKEMDIIVESDAVTLNNLQGIEVEVKEVDVTVESNAVNLNNQNSGSDIEIQESDNEILDTEREVESDDKEEEGSDFDEDNEDLVYDPISLLGGESSEDFSQKIDSQIVPDFDEEVETDEEIEKTELFDSAALTALFKAATGTVLDGGNTMFQPTEGSRIYSLERPTGLGPILGSFRPTLLQNGPNFANGEPESEQILSEEDNKRLEKIQQIRVKFLRLVKRLGFSSEDSVVAQVLYQLILAAGVAASHQELGLEYAEKAAIEAESEGKSDLRFSLNILVIGKGGVGKSATINSIFGEDKAAVNAFESETNTIKEIVGTIDGVEIRVLDTPGLKYSVMEQPFNKKILSSIKRYTKKCPPDVVLYVDRVDSQTSDLNDLPLFKSITSCLGASIWRNTVVALTHAASTPFDRPNGSPINYELLVAQRSRVIKRLISYSASDLHIMNSGLINPVAVVENHPSCKKNGDGDLLLPDGESWRPKLLLLCYSTKILSELSYVVKNTPELSDHTKIFGFRMPGPPLSYFLSSLLQSTTHPKLDDLDQEFEYLSDSDQENEDEYDQLPPFKPLKKTQIENLSKEQRNAYFEEYDYRVKLLQKKQIKEMKNRSRDKIEKEDDQEIEDPSTVSEPLPDKELPLSFDSENPAYRYRYLEPTSQILIRPVTLDTDKWDHYQGYSGVSMDQNLDIANRFPTVIGVQLRKDKKDFNIHLDSTVSAQLGENGSAMAQLEVHSMGKQQLSYNTLKVETKFKNLKRNKTTAGLSVSSVGENVVSGFKIEDQLAVGKRLVLVGTTGAVGCQGDLAYGTNLELRVRNRDFLIGQDRGTVSLSLVRWKGEVIWGCNLNSQFCVGRNCEINLRAVLNNRRKGQISVKTSSSDQLQIALAGLVTIIRAVFWKMFVKSGEEE